MFFYFILIFFYVQLPLPILATLSVYRILSIFASLVAFLVLIISLAVFAVDIAVFASIRTELDRFGAGTATNTGPGSVKFLFFLNPTLIF